MFRSKNYCDGKESFVGGGGGWNWTDNRNTFFFPNFPPTTNNRPHVKMDQTQRTPLKGGAQRDAVAEAHGRKRLHICIFA